jgi:hypothetical protein
MRNVEATLISQYGNSATISQLVHNIDLYLDPRADIDNFFDWVWNIETAQGFGLDIWGRIIGVSREVFSNPIYYLNDSDYRALLLLKALSNISSDTAPAINQLLRNWLAGRGKTYMNDLGQMQIQYKFEFLLEPFEIEIITASGIFLRPAGVGATILQSEFPVFGFSEMGTLWAAPFDQAPFIAEDATHVVE